jgi:hypothetical protein
MGESDLGEAELGEGQSASKPADDEFDEEAA